MSSIKKFEAKEILDSLGYPTLRGRLYLENGDFVQLDIPSPVNPDSGEPAALRDGNKRYLGYGMKKAAKIITEGVTEKLKGVSVFKQKEIDLWLEKSDSTLKKEVLGVSTILLVSLLVAKAGAKVKKTPLFLHLNQLYQKYFDNSLNVGEIPTLIITMINGGKQVNNPLNFKEFYIVPSSSLSFSRSLELGMMVYHKLKEVLEYRNILTSTADQGGFSPNIYSNLNAFELIVESLLRLDLKVGIDVFLGVDAGADDFRETSGYLLSDNPQAKDPDEYYKYVKNFVKNYNVIYLEDILAQKDLKLWQQFLEEQGEFYYLSHDHSQSVIQKDLAELIKEKKANTVVLKLLRYGTLTSFFKEIDFCRKNNLSYVISQEVSETNETFIADLAVGVQATFVKFGAPVRGERVAKYNRFLEIENELLTKK